MRYLMQLIKNSFRMQFTYRTALFAGLLTNLFFGVLRAAVLIALYAGKTSVNGMNIEEAVTYVALSQGLIAFLSIFGYYDVMRSVYSGDIAGDLIRPAGLFFTWMGRDVGRSVVNLIMRGLLLMVIFGFFFDLVLPANGLQWLWVLFSMVLSWGISFCWRFLVNLFGFWTPDAVGIGRMMFAVSQLFCGFILPLRLLPDWFARLADFTPFPSMMNSTVEIFLGTMQGVQVIQAILTQVLWLAILYALCQVILALGIRRLVIQGG